MSLMNDARFTTAALDAIALHGLDAEQDYAALTDGTVTYADLKARMPQGLDRVEQEGYLDYVDHVYHQVGRKRMAATLAGSRGGL